MIDWEVVQLNCLTAHAACAAMLCRLDFPV